MASSCLHNGIWLGHGNCGGEFGHPDGYYQLTGLSSLETTEGVLTHNVTARQLSTH